MVTVSRLNTGEGAANVLPDAVRLAGTIRSFSDARFATLRERVGQVLRGTAEAHGCNTSVEWSETPYPPTVNDAALAALALGVAARVPGVVAAQEMHAPYFYAEDFSFYGGERGLWVRGGGRGSSTPPHPAPRPCPQGRRPRCLCWWAYEMRPWAACTACTPPSSSWTRLCSRLGRGCMPRLLCQR